MRILIAEDESVVRAVARVMLETSGHEVFVAANGREALNIVEREHESIDLVLTDVIMPQMGGKELAAHLASRSPATKILYMSAYTDALMHGALETGTGFLEKPFTPDKLLRSVSDLLAQSPTLPLPSNRKSPTGR
jgi:CheY-like chemotaxis protein